MMQFNPPSKALIFYHILCLTLVLVAGAARCLAEERFEFDHFKTGFELDGQHRQVDCQDCHVQGQFKGTPRACIFCHDGRTAISASTKSPQHIATSEPCEDCHSTKGWNYIERFDHNAVSGSCAGCHNGVNATGKDSGHLTTTQECSACHSSQAWRPATFDHSSVVGGCSDCHDGSNATGKSAGHFATSANCDSCHNTVNWLSSLYSHSGANYPDHQRTIDCNDCHRSNSEVLPWPNASLAPDCGACHSNDYKPDEHKKTESPTTVLYTAGELRDCTGSCHEYTDNTFTTILKTRTNEHRVNQGDF